MTTERCATCGDSAVQARVIELREKDLALVEIEGRPEQISVALVDASVGDVVLVHAGVAIGRAHADA